MTTDERCEACDQPLVDPALANRDRSALLAQMAATIAAGMVNEKTTNYPDTTVSAMERDVIADVSVDLARRILERVNEP